jgi:hypothetical protein
VNMPLESSRSVSKNEISIYHGRPFELQLLRPRQTAHISLHFTHTHTRTPEQRNLGHPGRNNRTPSRLICAYNSDRLKVSRVSEFIWRRVLGRWRTLTGKCYARAPVTCSTQPHLTEWTRVQGHDRAHTTTHARIRFEGGTGRMFCVSADHQLVTSSRERIDSIYIVSLPHFVSIFF